MKKLLLIIIVVVLTTQSGHAFNRAVIDSLEREMASAVNTADSLAIAVNLYDASSRERQFERANTAFDLARRTGNTGLKMEMLRNLANINTSDSLFNYYLSCLDKDDTTPEQQLTRLYIKIRQNIEAARNSSAETSRERVKEIMDRLESPDDIDVLTRLEILFSLCSYLEQISNGELLTDHLKAIGDIIEAMPEKLDALTTLYLTQSSLTYTSMRLLDKAVKADKRMLEFLDHIEEGYHAKGRKFKDFAYGRYIIYRRLLGNYEALTPDEVDEYHSAARQAARTEPLAYKDFTRIRRPDMYYYMKHKAYHKALPLLKFEAHQTERPQLLYVRRLLVNCLIEASQATNDRETLLDALLLSRNLDDNEMTRESSMRYKELQLQYERASHKVDLLKLDARKKEASRANHRTIYLIGGISLLTVIMTLIIIAILWRKSKRLNLDLKKVNAKLTDERDTLQRIQADLIRTGERARIADKQREEFINNISHEVSTPLNAVVEYSQLIVDCIDENKKPYLSKFARIVTLNAELVLTLVNDVLDLASYDKKTLKTEKHPVMASSLIEVTLDTVKNLPQPSVEIVNRIEPDDNLILNTDPKRVTQVLYNLLDNAAKFTTEGTITLDGRTIADGNFYEFSVTDTGIGIPAGKEEIIFNRFEKLNRYSQGIGLGLSVSRMLATLLGGELKVDTSHKGSGARFIFTIPIR